MGRDACAIGDSAYTGALTGAPDAAREAAAAQANVFSIADDDAPRIDARQLC